MSGPYEQRCETMTLRHVSPPQIPRFAFEKFPGSKAELTTQMKSVGEAMAIGRTFQVRILGIPHDIHPVVDQRSSAMKD